MKSSGRVGNNLISAGTLRYRARISRASYREFLKKREIALQADENVDIVLVWSVIERYPAPAPTRSLICREVWIAVVGNEEARNAHTSVFKAKYMLNNKSCERVVHSFRKWRKIHVACATCFGFSAQEKNTRTVSTMRCFFFAEQLEKAGFLHVVFHYYKGSRSRRSK